MNYIQEVRDLLKTKIDVESDLLDLYTLLVLVRGQNCSLEDVHDAWSVWRNNTNSEHPSLIPFHELPPSVKELDRGYTNAIRETAAIFKR